MLLDASDPPNGQHLRTDLCVVGAGPAGICLAREFLGGSVRVCVLEAGGRTVERRRQRQSRGQSVGYPLHLLDRSRVRAFGGASRHWPPDEGMAGRPLDPIDFEAREGIAWSGWPFDRAHLDPWYARAQAACQLGPFDYRAATWGGPDSGPLPALDGVELETTVFQHGATSFEGRLDELAASANVTLVLHARVVGLATGADPGRVDRVEVARDDGSRLWVVPRVVVLATGGIENPRLLLLSGRDRRGGLGNDHDLVGRCFAERLSARTGYVAGASPALVRQAAFYEVHPVRGTRVQGALRLTDAVQRRRQLRNCAFFLLARPAPMTGEAVRSLATMVKGRVRRPLPGGLGAHLRNLATGLPDLGALAAARLRRRAADGEVLVLRAQAEQAPNLGSRVTLGSRRDDLGLPVARVDWRVSDDDRASIRASQQVLDATLAAAGLGRVALPLGDEDPPALFEGNFHHLGTTRIHPDPARGVVDADCRVHGVANLYVAGSSVFPTFGCSNPTLTLVALALRLAGHLRERLAGPDAGAG
jgi:choline dehydrogenase-like flavoprotein